jgi:hypothetical protein
MDENRFLSLVKRMTRNPTNNKNTNNDNTARLAQVWVSNAILAGALLTNNMCGCEKVCKRGNMCVKM